MSCSIITLAASARPGYVMVCQTHDEAPVVAGTKHCANA